MVNQKVKWLIHKILNKLERIIFAKTDGEICYIGGSEILPPPLSAEEERELLNRWEEDVETIKRTLIERNLRLVVYIAKKFENTSTSVEDLISIGTIGLIKAVNTFDP
ncbi:MAG: RNA polymerase sporulation sigma factor SigE, partial [Firmicutes bacterium]|nr:RNA polymerase sporulation sigma factor SigE [Bacillota bacterium]